MSSENMDGRDGLDRRQFMVGAGAAAASRGIPNAIKTLSAIGAGLGVIELAGYVFDFNTAEAQGISVEKQQEAALKLLHHIFKNSKDFRTSLTDVGNGKAGPKVETTIPSATASELLKQFPDLAPLDVTGIKIQIEKKGDIPVVTLELARKGAPPARVKLEGKRNER